MSPSKRRSNWYPPPSKPRAVEGGLVARSQRGTIGETWWSRRFLELLESFGMGPRLTRGRRYARQGQVLTMQVSPGTVTAKVQGSRARPYDVRIGVARLSEAEWRQVEAAMVDRAVFLAKLLAGEMPADIEAAFVACSVGLFPASLGELGTSCSCPDWANPCKHLAAVYYLLGEAFDDDPFLILAWRGRTRDVLLTNLRALRGDTVTGTATSAESDDGWAVIEATDIDPEVPFWGEASPPSDHLTFTPGSRAGAILDQFDDLDLDVAGTAVLDLLRPAYAELAAAAWSRLLTDDDPDPT